MKIDELDILDRIQIYKVDGLQQYIEERPESEDFGETLDLYRKRLIENCFLDKQTDSIIRGLHLQHQSRILNENNPINTVNLEDSSTPYVVKTFSGELHSIFGKNSILSIIDLYKKYTTYNNMYINSEIIEQLYKLKA